MDDRTKKIVITILALIIAGVSFFAGYIVKYYTTDEKTALINWVMNTIDDNYLVYDENGNPVKFTAEDYADAIADGLLDKYSTFLTNDELRRESVEREGNYSGTGLYFWINTVEPLIAEVAGNSPAEKAGVKKGEMITAVQEDGKEKTAITTYVELSVAFSKISKGVEFTLFTEKNGVEKEYTIYKADYVESYVWYYDSEKQLTFLAEGSEKPQPTEADAAIDMGLPEDAAYIRFSAFNGGAAEQFGEAINFMRERGRTKLILDLRNNGGGYIDVLSDMAGYLVNGDSANTVVATVKYKNGTTDNVFTSFIDYRDTDTVVLVNGNTASASDPV